MTLSLSKVNETNHGLIYVDRRLCLLFCYIGPGLCTKCDVNFRRGKDFLKNWCILWPLAK